jgi:hypothetical protein
MNFTTSPDLLNTTDADLEALLGTIEDTDTIVALVAEMDRRERAARKAERERARREAIRAEYLIAQHAAYLAADAACVGHLLSKAGKAKITDEHALWSGRESVARKYASEELNEWFDANGRLTIGEFTKQRAREARIARTEYREEVARIRALNAAARRAARNQARIAREAAKAERAARRTAPKLTVIKGGKTTTAPAAAA